MPYDDPETAPRLLDRTAPLNELVAAASSRLRLLTGPAGAGKSVLVDQFTSAGTEAVLRARGARLATGTLVRTVAERLGSSAHAVDELLTDLGARATIVVDDAHALADADVHDLNRLLVEAPGHIRFVVATRDARPLAVADVPGPVHRLGYERLRFTPEEVARLFDTVFHAPVPDPAALCERVEGLPIALRHLHLDTTLMADAERDAVLRDPVPGSARLREYLTDTVLGALPGQLRDFMVDVSPLGRLGGPLCDAMTGGQDSERHLAELAARQALTFHVGLTEFRFHTLLRELLELRLAERRGPGVTRRTYQTATTLLIDAGRLTDAYRCAARAEDWVTAARLAHEYGLPVTSFDDPWVDLAEARRLRAAGHFTAAHDRYRDAAARLPDGPLRWQCEQERIAASHSRREKTDDAPVPHDVVGHLTESLREKPSRMVTHAVPTANPHWVLARAVAAMVDGRIDLAVALAEPLAGSQEPFVSVAARLLTTAITTAVYGRGTKEQFYALASEAEAEGWLWLAMIARATTAVLDPAACADAVAVLSEFETAGDDWGSLIAVLVLLIGQLRARTPRDPEVLRRTLVRIRRMRAPLLEMWLRAFVGPEIEQLEADDPRLAETRPDRLWEQDMLAHNCAPVVAALNTPPLAAPAVPVQATDTRAGDVPPVAVRCFVAFELDVRGRPVPLDGLRAQARRVLRVLAVHYGQPIHEERLAAVLWPDTDLKPAKHRLQVAISSLRAFLRAHLPGEPGAGIARHGNAYLLRLPSGATVDVELFAAAMQRWRRRGLLPGAEHVREIAGEVLDLYRGELLAEEGAAEWVLAKRESLRGEAMGVAVALAQLEIDSGAPAAAVEVCERTLTIDELDHRLWTVLAEARARLGDTDGALRAQNAYQGLLADDPADARVGVRQ